MGERVRAAWGAARHRRMTALWPPLTTWGWTARAADVARVAPQPGLPIRADTVLRAGQAAADPPVADVRVVGIAEGAPRAGRPDASLVVPTM